MGNLGGRGGFGGEDDRALAHAGGQAGQRRAGVAGAGRCHDRGLLLLRFEQHQRAGAILERSRGVAAIVLDVEVTQAQCGRQARRGVERRPTHLERRRRRIRRQRQQVTIAPH